MTEIRFSLCESCEKCPEVLIQDEEIHITDDYGGHVLLTRDEVETLIKRIKS